jgi:uncharacterized protein
VAAFAWIDPPLTHSAQRQIKPNYGPYASEQEALDALVSRLVAALDPQMIWLFGSRERGDARPDSDFDLLVVAKPDGAFGSDDYELIDMPIRDTRIGCDLVPCSYEAYQAGLGLRTSFVAQIVDSGRRIYSADTSWNFDAAPHPPSGHLLPVRTGKKGRQAPLFPSPRHLRGEGGPQGRMRGSSEGAELSFFQQHEAFSARHEY